MSGTTSPGSPGDLIEFEAARLSMAYARQTAVVPPLHLNTSEVHSRNLSPHSRPDDNVPLPKSEVHSRNLSPHSRPDDNVPLPKLHEESESGVIRSLSPGQKSEFAGNSQSMRMSMVGCGEEEVSYMCMCVYVCANTYVCVCVCV
jgi:hypothetical protein